jgi:hypothetical protein
LKDPRKIYWKYIQSKPEYVLDMPKMPYKSWWHIQKHGVYFRWGFFHLSFRFSN